MRKKIAHWLILIDKNDCNQCDNEAADCFQNSRSHFLFHLPLKQINGKLASDCKKKERKKNEKIDDDILNAKKSEQETQQQEQNSFDSAVSLRLNFILLLFLSSSLVISIHLIHLVLVVLLAFFSHFFLCSLSSTIHQRKRVHNVRLFYTPNKRANALVLTFHDQLLFVTPVETIRLTIYFIFSSLQAKFDPWLVFFFVYVRSSKRQWPTTRLFDQFS